MASMCDRVKIMENDLALRALMVVDWVVIAVSATTLLSAYGLRVFRFDDSLRKIRRNLR